MAQDKNTKKKTAAKATNTKTERSAKKEPAGEKVKKPYNENAVLSVAAPYIISFFGIFLIITFIFRDSMNIVGELIGVFYGLFSYATWLVPPAMFLIAARWKKDAPQGIVHFRVICAALCVVFFSSFLHLVLTPNAELTLSAKALYTNGTLLSGGGVIGGWICFGLYKLCGSIGTGIITLFFAILFGFLIFGVTFSDLWALICTKVRELFYDASKAHEQRREEAKAAREQQKLDAENDAKKDSKKTDHRYPSSVTELGIEDNSDEQDIELDDTSKEEIKPEIKKKEKKEKDFLSDFFPDTEKDVTRVPDDELEPEKTGLEESYTGPDMSAFGDGDMDDIFCDDAVIEGAGATFNAKDIGAGGSVKSPDTFGESDDDMEDIPFDTEQDSIEADKPTPEELYEFPSVDMLPGNPNPSVFKVTDELTETAKNLVTTLASFGVRTKVMNISCGPTVTRYELKPEVGVKVRSIQNLADDIALHLRASAVRIEAPIPGKDAVGIEIPNKTVSTVFIKELIDRDEFRELKSKLSVALGMDVSGTPVYMDIAKMPHLLIAGATGMGKSVCINSFIISIIYKARPDEVKLILIDPKKVEFAMYDRIPHLLVPVVTDPKKAAGSLAWAVNEMEHRFNLIEAAKCRDIKSYNAVCEKDTRFKKMSQIVIIIDELADLMMTARDEVETSICRLAQKARAAGMHLIIGTQRPSVDVITGVIKANVPSRIAFTVASQVDSRTILDVVGAENLVGKGDMLFAPVGSMKPTRVQGSFVGPDSVIEEITNYLRESGITSYDDEIQSAIEKEAQRCSEKKKGKGAGSDSGETYVGSTDGFERDEMMLPALEIGVEMGQISTSLIQRKLSLGYARAARIVDMLSEMGFVGPFEGSKPRKVLITRPELLELKMKQSTDEEVL